MLSELVIFRLSPISRVVHSGAFSNFFSLIGKPLVLSRHGDIENILSELTKAGAEATGNGFLQSMMSVATGGSKFSKSDIKRVYFGNWLRDYSQAMDIAGLSKLSADTLTLLLSVLGFMTFGYATDEFEVTAERVGVYLPVEHIDNPKGYAAKEGDARQFHPKLRPPVDDQELGIDERNGMKNYMATEDGGWDTSTAHVRRVFRKTIEIGRRAGNEEGLELFEAYRLLGTGLHTLEDLLAHSNWVEIGLRKMGYEDVFCHVGDHGKPFSSLKYTVAIKLIYVEVLVNSPGGPIPPLVTGTFGGADFLHSLMGEATDKISQASVTDLSAKLEAAKGKDASGTLGSLKDLLDSSGGGSEDEKLTSAQSLEQKSKAYHFNPDDVCPPDVQQNIKDLIRWRDDLMRDISRMIESIPGLSEIVEELTDALNEYVLTVLTPYVAPILSEAMGVLDEGSKTVIDSDDQYEVFNNPHASDPSHSILSKDHFGLILNEPAGKIAQIVVIHTVNLIVRAWGDDSNPDEVIDVVLEAFHHPYYTTGQSQVQNDMFSELEKWFEGLGEDQAEVLQRLTKESVREGKNKRIGSEEYEEEAGYGGHSNCGHGNGKEKKEKKGKHGGHYEEEAEENSEEEIEEVGEESALEDVEDEEYYDRRRQDSQNDDYEERRSESPASSEDSSNHGGYAEGEDEDNLEEDVEEAVEDAIEEFF
ncbi:heterokaryon incompatibility Het-C [Flagelloscypha sp. PMI_526]|nr:heterokaryon incompatibility Het-C [Flagelloscypha sp. PMI_526]